LEFAFTFSRSFARCFCVSSPRGVEELAVVAAEFLFLLHDVGLETLVGKRQGCRDAGEPPPMTSALWFTLSWPGFRG